MIHYATFILSLLPYAWLERLLTAVAWLQLFILSAKGVQSKEIHKAQKKKKKKKPKRKKSIADVGMVHSSSQKFMHQTHVGTSELDVLGDTILFESNEQHRREFEGFLRSVKDIKDVHNWLKNFSNEAPRKVAIVKLSRRILDTDYGTAQAASALSFMFKFGLYPIVVHGGWNELARDTITEVIARRKLFSQRLKAEIRKCGVGAAVLTSDVCNVEPAINRSNDPFKDNLRFSGFVSAVGEGRRASLHMEGGLGFQVNNIDHERLIAYLEKGKIPIWDGVATTTEGAEVPLNGDVTTVELAHLLHPFRIIFACNDGGILDKDHKPIPVVYMDNDYADLMNATWVSQRRKIQLLQLRRIVSVVPPSCTVVVTAIDSVTHQLMYPRLANETIIKRAEENVVHVIEDVNKIDKEKLKVLIEDSFGRPLASDYLDNLNDNLHRIYLVTGMDGEYNGCAVTLKGVQWDPNNNQSDSDSDTLLDTPSEYHSLSSSSDSDSPLNSPQSDSPHHISPHTSPKPSPPNSVTKNLVRRVDDTNNHSSSSNQDQSQPDHVYSQAQKHVHYKADHSSSTAASSTSASSLAAPSALRHSVSANDLCDTNSSVSTEDYQFYYLCKFCVRKAAQGLGLGDLLWRCIQRDIDKLYWRSRSNNPLNAWYYARCQGSFRANGHFTVFWYGDDKFEDGAMLINDALSKSVTILPVPT